MKNQIKELLNLKNLQINQAKFKEITLKSQKKKKKKLMLSMQSRVRYDLWDLCNQV